MHQINTRRSRALRKAREWVIRYGPAEICGTITALLGAWIGHSASGSLVVAAVSGTIGENIGYYGYSVTREVLHCFRQNHLHARSKRLLLTAWHTLRNMLIEFGPAELLDSFLVRPASFYVLPLLTNNFFAGIIAGKLLADVVFYGIAIIGYELRKKYFPDTSAATEESGHQ